MQMTVSFWETLQMQGRTHMGVPISPVTIALGVGGAVEGGGWRGGVFSPFPTMAPPFSKRKLPDAF